MRLTHKIYLAIVAALLIGSLFFVARDRMEDLLRSHGQVLHDLSELERIDEELNGETWKTAFMLYNNYDVVNGLLGDSRDLLGKLKATPTLSGALYTDVSGHLADYEHFLRLKDEAAHRFTTLNSLIKNSTTYIPTLTNRYLTAFGHGELNYLRDMTEVTSLIFLVNNALDPDLLEGINVIIKRLEKRDFTDPQMAEFNRVFLSHAKVFEEYLPEYLPTFYAVLDSGTSDALHWASQAFVKASAQEADRVSLVSLVITIAFVLSIFLIVYFLVDVERKHKEMVVLHTRLETAATTDRLTELPNRFQFERDHEATPDGSGGLLIVNIDGFKNINDVFGHAAGDQVLHQMGRVLGDAIADNSGTRLYRIGADDFAVLLPEADVGRLRRLAHSLMTVVEQAEFRYQDSDISISVTVGASQHEPLLETADMALKRIKLSRSKYLAYNPELHIHERVESNLKTLNCLTDAIQTDRIRPHFMPVLNIASGRVNRFESLIRVETEEGKLLYPNDFLPVAKESRLYAELTRIMIRKALEAIQSTDYEFAINLSIEDLLDHEVTGFLFDALTAQPDAGRRLTLEILESEEVDNYEAVQDFVLEAKRHGCRIAIDDFGSGYSSLMHLLNLDVDELKIDASLVRHIDTDANSRAVVAAIIGLAKEVKIPSVTAEFVHNEQVLRIISEMGIQSAQGFYIGKPEPELVGGEWKATEMAAPPLRNVMS